MRALAWIVAAGLVLAGCGADDRDDTTDESAPSATGSASSSEEERTTEESKAPSPTTREPVAGTVVTTADSEFGEMLFDASGQAIYLFDKETSTRPDCYDACAEAWPPVLTKGDPQADGAVDTALIGTTKRSDGSTQVTYGGHPLYYYAHEDKFEVLCHNVSEYGGLWLVVTPRGEPAPV